MMADLDALRTLVGTLSNVDNTMLSWALSAAQSNVRPRVYPDLWADDDTQYAVLLKAARLSKARNQSEGQVGWAALGVQQVLADDPIEAGLLEHKRDMTKAGVA